MNDTPRAPALADLRAAHAEQSRPWDPYPTCSACTRCACYQPVAWPCDVARVLAAVDAEATIVQAAEALSVARQQLIALLARNAPGAEIQRASFALEAAWGPLDVAVAAARGEGA